MSPDLELNKKKKNYRRAFMTCYVWIDEKRWDENEVGCGLKWNGIEWNIMEQNIHSIV